MTYKGMEYIAHVYIYFTLVYIAQRKDLQKVRHSGGNQEKLNMQNQEFSIVTYPVIPFLDIYLGPIVCQVFCEMLKIQQ